MCFSKVFFKPILIAYSEISKCVSIQNLAINVEIIAFVFSRF